MSTSHFTSLQDRRCAATITKVGDHYVDLRIVGKINAKRARLSLEHMLNAETPVGVNQNYRVHQQVNVFLMRQSKKAWQVSEKWHDLNNNPWMQSLPLMGQTIAGKVIRYVAHSGCIVRLDHNGLDGYLSLEEIPTQARLIQDAVEIGDRLKMMVVRIDTTELDIILSIRELPPLGPEGLRFTPDVNIPSPPATTSTNLSEVSWAIIDDDTTLTNQLKKWAESYGAKVYRVNNHQHLKQLLDAQALTHVSLDWNLREFDAEYHQPEDWMKLLNNQPNMPKAVISGGNDVSAQQTANNKGYAFIHKPASAQTLFAWLTNQSLPDKSITDVSADLWALPSMDKDIIRRAQRRLKAFTQEHGLLGGFTTLKQREGSYQIRAEYKLNNNQASVEYRLNDTIVHEVTAYGKEKTLSAEHTGVLQQLFPLETRWVFGVPILDDPAVEAPCTRTLILFSTQPFMDKDKSAARQLAIEFGYLTELLAHQEAWEDDREMAPLGRLYAATIHEFNNKFASLYMVLGELRGLVKNNDQAPEHWSQTVNTFLTRWEPVDRLVQSAHGLVQKDKPKQMKLRRVIDDVMTTFEAAIADGSDTPSVQLYGGVDNLALDFPQLPFEHALLNLLLNAAFHTPAKHGWIEIQLVITPPDARGYSIHLDVHDNGSGIKASDVETLFQPRHTIKGQLGMGMGLYASLTMLKAAGGDLRLRHTFRYGGSCFRISLPQTFGSIE